MGRFISRGFKGRQVAPGIATRLPPGQYLEEGFPVLTAGPTPNVPAETWRFVIDGMVAQKREWTWDEFGALPFETVPCDIHCVTKWSKLGTSFAGVSLDTLLAEIEPAGSYAMVHSFGGYTTNLAFEDLTAGKAWVVTQWEGEPCPASTAGRLACWSPTCTSGRAPSGCRGCGSWTTRSPVSGSPTATTSAATRGWSSAIGATDARRAARSRPVGDRHGAVRAERLGPCLAEKDCAASRAGLWS